MSIQPFRVSFGIVTPQLQACREFYVQHFGFEVATDLGWYVHLRLPSGGCDLGLVLPNRADLDGVFHSPFTGGGVYIGLEVPDAPLAQSNLMASGVPIASPLRDEPWGERHFVVRDPAGCLVNVWQKLSGVEPTDDRGE